MEKGIYDWYDRKYFKSAPLSDRLSNYLKIIEAETFL
jgi:hypothetical protein